MKTVFTFLILACLIVYPQQNFVGKHLFYQQVEGEELQSFVIIPEVNYSSPVPFHQTNTPGINDLSGTMIRWNYTEPAAIGSKCAVSGNGEYNAVGWYLNNQRISLYGNNNSTPVWEYPLANNLATYFVSLNYDGDLIAAGAYKNIYIFNNTSNIPLFNFDIVTLGGDPNAGPVALAQQHSFLVATANYMDSSVILGFNTSSTTPAWSVTIIPSTGSGGIEGLKLSGNDSLMIVNTYGEFWVIKTFTGEIIYNGLINPLSTSGTQASQGINYDGSIIATINYRGYVRVFQWNGTTYNLLWENQEPPGAFFNWANCVDVSDDGEYIAVGTLIFISSSEYNGTVKLYKTSEGGTVSWVYDNCGDNVTSVSFNKDANVLAASSWGAINNTTPDLYIFKVWEGNIPIFTVSTGGSFFDGAISSDGSTLIASGKAVHARTFGNGGLAYNLFVDTSDTNIPVELINFSANVSGNNVNLEWSTASEINNMGFEIQKRFNNDFFTIGFVEGAGTTTERKSYNFTDKNLNPGNYSYRLKQVDFDGRYEYSPVVEADVLSPDNYSLDQNYPNPFNPSTVINWQIPVDSYVSLIIYNVLGKEVVRLVNNRFNAGLYSTDFDASGLSSGIYFYTLEATGVDKSKFTSTKKMMIIK
jgi:hypothetical protein